MLLSVKQRFDNASNVQTGFKCSSVLHLPVKVYVSDITKQRQKLYRNSPNSTQIEVYTNQLKGLRSTIKMCRNIEQQSVEMEERLKLIKIQEIKQKSEKEKHKNGKEKGLTR